MKDFQVFPTDIAPTDPRANHRVIHKKSDTQAAVKLPQPEKVAERERERGKTTQTSGGIDECQK